MITYFERDPIFNGINAFLPEDRRILLDNSYLICKLTGKTISDLKRGDLAFKIAQDLELELQQKPSHITEVAFNPNNLFLPDSNYKSLAEQDNLVRLYIEGLRGGLRLKGVNAGIGRFADYGEIILQHLTAGNKLLQKGCYLYPSARTRTRVFPEAVSSQNYVVQIGPFESEGLRVDILSREEGDCEIGAWPLIFPEKTVN